MQRDKADKIIAMLEQGSSLRAAARSVGLAYSSVYAWITDDQTFGDQYARAREIGYKLLADELIEIADTPEVGIKTKTNEKGEVETVEGDMIEHRRLRVDTRKWMLARMLPKLYGDKVTHEVSGTIRHAHELSDDTLADIATRGSAGTVEAPAEPQKPSAIH
jgi:hypothetical protein